MTGFAVATKELASRAIVGRTERVPVRCIFCIGSDKVATAGEMNATGSQHAPWHFSKTPQHRRALGTAHRDPLATEDVGDEIKRLAPLGPSRIWGEAFEVERSRHDDRPAGKERRVPRDAAQNSDGAAVIGAITLSKTPHGPATKTVSLAILDAVRHPVSLADRVRDVGACVRRLGGLYALGAGDLVMTGPPADVAAEGPGDRLHGDTHGLPPVDLERASCH